jgi:hypothetical protein
MYDFRVFQACMKKTQLVILWGKFSQNFDLKKKMILTYANDFFMKKMTQICQISKKNNNQIARFLGKVLEGSKEYTRILVFFFLLSYLVCNQI